MKAGEAWWNGADEHFETKVDNLCPPELNTLAIADAARQRDGRYRDGLSFKSDILAKHAHIFTQFGIWKVGKMTELASVEATERANTALQKLDEAVKSFRSRVGNDLTSMKAASQRVQTEVQTMSKEYQQACALLNSIEFQTAIVNAERMAAALKTLNEVSAAKINVEVTL